MQSRKKILAAGEIIWDIYPDKKAIGGAPLNFAAHAALCGAQSALLSAVGKDKLGEKACEALKEFGVDTRFVGFPTVRPVRVWSNLIKTECRSIPLFRIRPMIISGCPKKPKRRFGKRPLTRCISAR